MSAPRFVLREPNSKGPQLIFLFVTLDDGRLKYSTARKILPEHWDGATQRPVATHKDPAIKRQLIGLQNKISAIDVTVKNYIRDTHNASAHTKKDELRALLDKITKPEKLDKVMAAKKDGFFTAVRNITADIKAGKILTPYDKAYSPGTIKNLNHTIDKLQMYQDGTGDQLAFDTITMQTYRDIFAFFNIDCNHSLNNIGNVVKNLKTFMRISHKAGMHNNPVYMDEDFRVPREDTTDIYLNDKELDALYNLELSGLQERVRDWFLIDCYTGLRISDIMGLTDNDVKDGLVRSVNDKTGHKVIVPINPRVNAILAKYGGRLPPKVVDVVMNRYIKKIAEKAKITGRVDYVITRGGKREEWVLERWQMVSNHTARRTFITNALKAGVDPVAVMQLAGIKKYSTLMRYNKREVDETAEAMKAHAHFK